MTLLRRPRDIAELKELAGKLPPKDPAARPKRTVSAARVRTRKPGLSAAPAEAMDPAAPAAPEIRTIPDVVEKAIAPAAIERALAIYEQLQPHDQSVIAQARKILTQHIYGMVDRGEQDEQRFTVGGLIHLKAIEREHGIKSAHEAEASTPA
jgi:hypothetical protein